MKKVKILIVFCSFASAYACPPDCSIEVTNSDGRKIYIGNSCGTSDKECILNNNFNSNVICTEYEQKAIEALGRSVGSEFNLILSRSVYENNTYINKIISTRKCSVKTEPGYDCEIKVILNYSGVEFNYNSIEPNEKACILSSSCQRLNSKVWQSAREQGIKLGRTNMTPGFTVMLNDVKKFCPFSNSITDNGPI